MLAPARQSGYMLEALEGRRFCDGTDLQLSLDLVSASAQGANDITMTASATGTTTQGTQSVSATMEFVTNHVNNGSLEAENASFTVTWKDQVDQTLAISASLSLNYSFQSQTGSSAEVFLENYNKKAAGQQSVTMSGSGELDNLNISSSISQQPQVELSMNVSVLNATEASVMIFLTIRW